MGTWDTIGDDKRTVPSTVLSASDVLAQGIFPTALEGGSYYYPSFTKDKRAGAEIKSPSLSLNLGRARAPKCLALPG